MENYTVLMDYLLLKVMMVLEVMNGGLMEKDIEKVIPL